MSHAPRTIVVSGATGIAGRAVCAAMAAAGHTVVAIGTDVGRLEAVHADARYECDLTDAEATRELAEKVVERFGRVDGLVHLVGGWKPGWGDEVTDWLNARLVTTLLNASAAFEGDLLASPNARLVIVSSTAVTRNGPPTSAYAAAKLAAEAWVEQLASRWQGSNAAAVTFVAKALGDKAGSTPVDELARRIVGLWDAPAAGLNGARIVLHGAED